ncbi:MAG: hypothetical protein AMXMBFR79_07570 [Chitinophagaceae bacterium]
MKQLLMPIVLLYLLSITACTKNLAPQDNRSTIEEEIYKVTKQINDAKNYFNNYVDTNVAQKFKKIPNWDKASVAQWNNN